MAKSSNFENLDLWAPMCTGPISERLALEMADPRLQKRVFRKHFLFVVTLLYIPRLPRRPASIKEAAAWKILHGGWLSVDMSDMKKYHDKNNLL